mgnify:CR=1 FL=1
MADEKITLTYQNETFTFPAGTPKAKIEEFLKKIPEKNLYNAPKDTIKRSGMQFFKDLYQVVRHPIETVKTMGALGHSIINLIRPGEQGNEELSKMVGQYFVDRYGGIENIKKTFRTDPVGFAADLSIILTGGATVVPKALQQTGRIGNIINKTANAVKATGNFIDPVRNTLLAGGLVAKYGVKPVASLAGDVIAGKPGGYGRWTGASYEAGKVGGPMQEAFQAGRGTEAHAVARDPLLKNVPIIGNIAEKLVDKWGPPPQKAGFIRQLTQDLENLKTVQRTQWNASIAKLSLNTIKLSKSDITKMLRHAEKNAKIKGVWKNTGDAKLFEKMIKLKDEVFSANINRNALGADTYIQRLNDLLKNNKKNALIMDVKNSLKNNINNKTGGKYNKVTEGFEEISKIENMADNILAGGDADKMLNNVKAIFKQNKEQRKIIENLNPNMSKNVKALVAGQEMSPATGNLVMSIAKGGAGHAAAGMMGIPGYIGTFAPLITGPRAISGAANVAGKIRAGARPYQAVLADTLRLNRPLQSTEDDEVFYNR